MEGITMADAERCFGWIPDDPDPACPRYAQVRAIAAADVPETLDQRPLLSPIENQQMMNACVGNAVVGALEFLENKYLATLTPKQRKSKKFLDLSRMFVYWNARAMDHLETKDMGCRIGAAVQGTYYSGVCEEKKWPYLEKNLFKKPSRLVYWFSTKRMVRDCYSLDTNLDHRATNENIKACLAEGYPIVFGTLVYDSFMSPGPSGLIPVPNRKTERIRGGHGMLFVGYTKTHFIVRNSWGSCWGDNGYCYMPFEYFDMSGGDKFDMWMIRSMDIPGAKPKALEDVLP